MKKTTNNNQNRLSAFALTRSAGRTRGSLRHPARLAFLVALTLITLVSVVIPSAAADTKAAHPAVTLAKLAGPWQATLGGVGTCGNVSFVITFTLNSSGVGSNVDVFYHTENCGDGENTDQVFNITSLNSDGSGTAEWSGVGGTNTFSIQVSANHQVFNMVDITDAGIYKWGTAIRQ
ncbi:MAG: hypothetical protein WBQ43_04320 [Terriglobales bacterium]